MGLFGGKKENTESKDTLEVKSATIGKDKDNDIDLNNLTPPSSDNINSPNLNSNSPENFVNPFANQSNPMNNPNENLFNNNMNNNFQGNNLNNNNQDPLNNSFNSNSQSQPLNNQSENLNSIDPMILENNSDMDFEKIQEMIDETVEKIIEDKWEKLLLSIEKVVNWKEKAEAEVNDLKSSISEIKESFNNLEKKLSNKISSYDSGLLDVNSEIKALEKVFQKITPTLINNVNELSSIAKSIKESTGVKGVKNLDNKI